MKGSKFGIRYGDLSSAAGLVGTDTVNIGGVEVPGQAVELATKVSGSFIRDLNSDGLVGLGFGVGNQGVFSCCLRTMFVARQTYLA